MLLPKICTTIVNIPRTLSLSPGFVRCLATESSPLKDKTIGVIGLGHVGSAVTKNLLKQKFNVTTLLDKDQARCNDYPCSKAKTPKQLVEDCDITITALPMPPDVKAVAEGDAGLLSGLSQGKIWIDHSTTDYEQTMKYNDITKAKGSWLLEAPITGGLEALKKGQMTVFMAGENDLAEELRPLMKASFQNVLYTGELGTAMIPKVFSNILAAVNIIAAGEILMVAKKAGLDLKTFWDCVRSSSGNSFVWETGGPMVFQGTYDPSFDISLHCKDNQLCFDIAKKHKVPIEFIGMAQHIFLRTMYQYGEGAPCYSFPKTLEDALKENLRCDDFKNWKYSIDDIDGSAVIRHHGIKLSQDEDKSK